MTGQTMDQAVEFSRPISVTKIHKEGWRNTLTATAEECEALAARMGVEAVQRFTADIEIFPMAGGTMFRLDAHVSAELEQACVVTLEPVQSLIEDRFEILFGPGDAELDQPGGKEFQMDLDAPDPPEPVIDGMIDPGEVLVQQIITLIDPFPRKSGAKLPDPPEGVEAALRADWAEDTGPGGEAGGNGTNPKGQGTTPEKQPTHRPFADLATLLGKKQ
ncbi:MAG: YceD family protein [Rhodospirillaceae bacterium]